MKRIIIMILTLLIMTINVNAADNSNLNESITALKYFINRSVELGDLNWEGFSIEDYETIVDNQLEEYGYVFNLSSKRNEGYAIVTCENDVCSVVEASFDSPSPFKKYEKTHYLMYCSPLEYLAVEKSETISENPLIEDIETKESVLVDKDTKVRFVNEPIARSIPGETIKYISQYYSKFNAINQNETYNCVATSMAMCLRYLHNIGTISITIGSNTNPSAATIRNKITSYYSYKNGDDSVVRPAINTFGSNFCSPKISTKGNGFWGNSEQTDISFQTIIDEIDSNCPLVMMFNPEKVDSSIKERHATTCVGYKTINNDASTGLTLNYTIVRMPEVSSSSSVATKQVGWNYTNVHGYYLVYIG